MKYMLSGEININSHGILNENKCAYEVTGRAFFKKTSERICQYEWMCKWLSIQII